MRALLSPLVGFALLAACQPRTEIVIGFATNYAAPTPLDEIALTVIRQDGFPEGGDGLTWAISGSTDEPYNLPASYGIYSDGGDVQLDVTLAGMNAGSAIVSQTVTLSLVGGQTLFYRMGLTEQCSTATTTCSAQTTCIEGTCSDPAVPVAQLPTYTPDLVTELTCIPPVVRYTETATGADMPFSKDAASCPPSLCVQGLCLKPPGASGNGTYAYLKPSDVSAGAFYGSFGATALSGDGNTLVVGGPGDSTGGSGVNPASGEPTISSSGGVYVFVRSGTTWTKQAFFKASNASVQGRFGASVAISGDGSTIAIGATGDASDATTINGSEAAGPGSDYGAVFVYTLSGTTWTQAAYIKPSAATDGGAFGRSVSLSQDGTTLAVGEDSENSTSTGVNSTPMPSGEDNGAVFVFTQASNTWTQQAYIKPLVTNVADYFGAAVSLSSDGNTLAIGAFGESNSATGIDGTGSANGAPTSGAAYIFTRTGTTWMQQHYIKPSNTQTEGQFGDELALSADGTELVVGSPFESSSATGINGNQTNMSAPEAGAVYAFAQTGGVWAQQAYIKASNTQTDYRFGIGVGLSGDGTTLVVGSSLESSDATGVDGNQSNTGALDSGAAYIFKQTNGAWTQQHYLKPSNTRANAEFGDSTTVSMDGSTFVVGAPGDSSNATGVNGNESNTSAADTGAAFVFPP